MKSRLKRVALGLGGILLLAGCLPLEFADLERTATYNVTVDAVELEVMTSNGNVEIVGAAGATEVRVTARLWSRGTTAAEAMARLAQINVDMIQVGNLITLRYDAVAHPIDVRRFSGVDFQVEVPETTHASVQTSNGRIEVTTLTGVLDLLTSNGRVEVEDSLVEATARTSNGRICFAFVEGILDLETSNGAIELESVDGVVNAETSNGSITYAGYLLPDVDHSMVTTNGNIDLAIRSDASLIVNATTSNGQIVSTLPLIGDTAGKEWSAVLNPPATGTLTLQTSNGQITMHGIF